MDFKFKVGEKVYFLNENSDVNVDVFNPKFPLEKIPMFCGEIIEIHIGKEYVNYGIQTYDNYWNPDECFSDVPENSISTTKNGVIDIFVGRIKNNCNKIIEFYEKN